jgi:hypothetical protein
MATLMTTKTSLHTVKTAINFGKTSKKSPLELTQEDKKAQIYLADEQSKYAPVEIKDQKHMKKLKSL